MRHLVFGNQGLFTLLISASEAGPFFVLFAFQVFSTSLSHRGLCLAGPDTLGLRLLTQGLSPPPARQPVPSMKAPLILPSQPCTCPDSEPLRPPAPLSLSEVTVTSWAAVSPPTSQCSQPEQATGLSCFLFVESKQPGERNGVEEVET